MREYKISQELKPFLRKILIRRNIPFKIIENNKQLYIKIPLSGERFHEIVMRAKCEKISKETGIFHVTKKESENQTKLTLLLKEYGQTAFHIVGSENRID